MTNSMTKYQTTFEATQNLIKCIEIGHGENADLVANFTDGGVPVNLSGYVARALFQPKSEWGTDNWYECPCEVSGNTAIAHWGNAYDNGENAVKMFIHLSKDGKVAYPALYRIGLFQTPGFTPSAIEPIPETIDFSQYTLVNAPWVLEADEAFSVRRIDATEASSSEYPFVAKTNEMLGIEVESDYADDGIYLQLPDGDISKAVNFYINVQNKTDHTVTLWLAVYPWVEGHGMAAWETVTDGDFGSEIYNVEAGENATFHIFEMGTRGYAYRYQLRVSRNMYSKADTTLSTVYTQNPRFTDWETINYTFTVSWNESQSLWIFNFNETNVSGDTEEWSDPNATHLYVNYDGISLEANRTRLDVGYVLGSQTDKPLQPMGDYATTDDLNSVNYLKIKNDQNGINLQDDIKVYWYAFETAQSTSYTIPNPNLSQIQSGFQYFDYELEIIVPSNATSISGPQGWAWITGYELPTSDFAGKTIYIKCRLMCFDKPETIAQVWRVA